MDLPDPLGPITETTPIRGIVNVDDAIATKLPYRSSRSVASTMRSPSADPVPGLWTCPPWLGVAAHHATAPTSSPGCSTGSLSRRWRRRLIALEKGSTRKKIATGMIAIVAEAAVPRW